ncbi:MAG: CvpA family protein [Lachnospiraceae bacterium]|nr:CvpA family protein [Lachnospiraceae bacterium]
MQINLIMIIVILLIAGGAVKGWKKGMVKELSSLIGLIGALAAIMLFVSAVQNYQQKDNREMLIAILGFVIVILAYKVVDFILTSLKLLTHLPILGGLDHLAGIAIGAGEGLLLVWIAFLLITAFNIAGLRNYLLAGVQENEWLLLMFYNNYIAAWIAEWSV